MIFYPFRSPSCVLGDGVIKMVRTSQDIYFDILNNIINVEEKIEKTKSVNKQFDLKKKLTELYDLADQLEKVF